MKNLKAKTPKQLTDTLAKTQSVIFRVSKTEKAEMQETAKSLGLTLTEYFSRLHAIAKDKLK